MIASRELAAGRAPSEARTRAGDAGRRGGRGASTRTRAYERSSARSRSHSPPQRTADGIEGIWEGGGYQDQG
eukprot:702291-Rhodomonas_salina.1